MILFLYGEDAYRSHQKLNEAIDRYKQVHKCGLDFEYFDFSTVSGQTLSTGQIFQDFFDKFKTISMFREKKFFILKQSFSNQEFKQEFLKNKKEIQKSKNIILFYEEGKVLANDSLFRFLKKYAQCQEFKFLTRQELKRWAEKEIQQYHAKINYSAMDCLIDYVGQDLARLSNEIKKLASYKKTKEIEIKDIELLVKPNIDKDIFKTIDALATRNKKQALYLIRKHLELGDSPLYLLSMINFQFRNILTVKKLQEENNNYQDIVRKTKFHPYVVKKSCFAADRFKLEELKKIYHQIFEADFRIKTGRINPAIALDLLITGI